jgi:carbonic anhydrase
LDARLVVEEVLGLQAGDAHVIRNAGGLATDDAVRSLVISHQLLRTEEVIVIEHTGCGMLGVDDDEVRREIAGRTGGEEDLGLGGFDDLETNLRAQVDRIRAHAWIKDVPVHGLAFEVETGRVREVV